MNDLALNYSLTLERLTRKADALDHRMLPGKGHFLEALRQEFPSSHVQSKLLPQALIDLFEVDDFLDLCAIELKIEVGRPESVL